MLFNSYEFLLIFLPVVLIGYYLIGSKQHHRLASSWLLAASLFFYGWWNPAYVGLILFSIIFNYALGLSLASDGKGRRLILSVGIIVNLSLLAYFKYTVFVLDNVNGLLDTGFDIPDIILPLAISFFTFQQIAYLVDAYQQKTKEYNFLQYSLFVTFFPQLIAGPIVHHREMMTQFSKNSSYRFNAKNLELGLAVFTVGLFKKVVIADGIAAYSTPVFNAATSGAVLSFFDGWTGALAYTFQLYFDFSAYSDMAIGIGLMFGIRLPINFFSPYKAVNIIDFWRRWHMTLSRFLRDYLYFPLGGNRKGTLRRYTNLFITMLLGGLWHGAGWTFVFWGGLHGIYLAINHAWHALRRYFGHDLKRSSTAGRGLSVCLTFIAVVVGWVFFRADNLDAAFIVLNAMFSPFSDGAWHTDLFSGGKSKIYVWMLSLSVLVWCFPNVQQWSSYRPFIAGSSAMPSNTVDAWWRHLAFRASLLWAGILGVMTIYVVLHLTRVSEFLYFQF